MEEALGWARAVLQGGMKLGEGYIFPFVIMAKETVNWETTQSWARTRSTLTAHIHLTPNSHFMIWVQGCIPISTCRKELSGNPKPLLIKQPGACMLRLWWYEFMPWCPHISEFNILDITWEMNRGLSIKKGTSDETPIWERRRARWHPGTDDAENQTFQLAPFRPPCYLARSQEALPSQLSPTSCLSFCNSMPSEHSGFSSNRPVWPRWPSSNCLTPWHPAGFCILISFSSTQSMLGVPLGHHHVCPR